MSERPGKDLGSFTILRANSRGPSGTISNPDYSAGEQILQSCVELGRGAKVRDTVIYKPKKTLLTAMLVQAGCTFSKIGQKNLLQLLWLIL